MTRGFIDYISRRSSNGLAQNSSSLSPGDPQKQGLIHLNDAEPPWLELFVEWLLSAGYQVSTSQKGVPRVIVLSVPFPKTGDMKEVRRIREKWPEARIVIVSPTFHSTVEMKGDVARQIKVDGVVPLPVGREQFIALLNSLM